MKRLIYIISTFLFLAGMYGGNVGAGLVFSIWQGEHKVPARKFSANENQMSDSDKRIYVEWIEDSSLAGGYEVALAQSRNGWAAGFGGTLGVAQQTALSFCRRIIGSDSCKIVDVNGTSAFIKQRGSSSSSSTASSSNTKEIFCATASYYWSTDWVTCSNEGGKAFDLEYQAKAEHKRLKGTSSSSYSFTASSSNTKEIFCATASYYWSTVWVTCSNEGGKAFDSEYQAKAEHKRLKGASTPVVKTVRLTIRSNVSGDSVYIDGNFKGSTRLDLELSKGRHTIRIEKDGYKTYEEGINLTDNLILRGHLVKIVDKPVQTVVVDNTVEVEFWKSIKDSDDPDMYQAYLESFPEGKFAPLAKLKIKKLGGTTTSVAQSLIPNLDYGRYHALVIGNDRYQHLKNLSTAVNDANAVASLLRSRYQFNVDVLTNATRDETVSALSRLRRTISSKDNLLIYYAGHGWLDKDMDEGFWLPVDAVDDDQVHWIANDTIMRSVRAMKAKHVMVVADSCFSGTLIRGIKIRERSPDYIKQIVQKKARTALTSGGLEPVTDVGGGDHSIFAATFMRILNENTGVLDGHQLFTTLRKQVMMNADQTPEYGDIRKAGHDGGDFLFVRQ